MYMRQDILYTNNLLLILEYFEPQLIKDTMKAYFCYCHCLFKTMILRLFYSYEIYTTVLLLDTL